jgi:hypothetical protein
MPTLTESKESSLITQTAIGAALLTHFKVYKDVFKGPIHESDFDDSSAQRSLREEEEAA